MSEGRGPKKIGDILGAVLAKYGCTQTTAQLELETAWQKVADERTRKHTRIGSLRRGVLEILVDNSALLGELESFHKESLLEQLRKIIRHERVTSLRFRRK